MALKRQESGNVSCLSDDLVNQILTRIKVQDDRKSCSEVCKQWLRVERLSHSSIVVLHRHDFLITTLARFLNLVKFETWNPMSDKDLEFLAKTCPKLENVKLKWCQEDGDCGVLTEKGLMALGNGCPKLSGVSIFGEGRVRDSGIAVLVHCAANLKFLCLGDNSLISDEALEAIGSASSCSIEALELRDCCNITDRGLRFLANGNVPQTLKELVLVRCYKITASGIVHFRSKMCSLEPLQLIGSRSLFLLRRRGFRVWQSQPSSKMIRKKMALESHESGNVSLLSDDLLGQILTRIKAKDDRKWFSEVCKQWLRAEGLTRYSLQVLHRHDFVITALARFPDLVRFATWKPMTDTDLELLAKTCPQLEIAMFHWCQQDGDGGFMSEKGLTALANGCPKLTEIWISGEGRVGDSGVAALLHCAANLKCLYLKRNNLISDQALEAIGSASSRSIDTLQLTDCCNVTDRGLGFLADGNTSQTLSKLVLVGCNQITDAGIVHLSSKMCSLEHLELSLGDNQRLTDVGGVAISTMQTLKVLRLNGQWDVSNRTMFALAENCGNLRKLSLGIKGLNRANLDGCRAVLAKVRFIHLRDGDMVLKF